MTINSSVTTLESSAPATKAPSKKDLPAQVLAPVSGSGDFSGKYAKLRIAINPDAPGGKDAVFMGVAGTGFQVPRGRDWIVPVELANVMRDANITTYDPDDLGKNTVRVESPRFSFMAVDLSDEEAALLLSAQREQISAAG